MVLQGVSCGFLLALSEPWFIESFWLMLLGVGLVGLAWRANRRTSLGHALVWAMLACLSWFPAFWAHRPALPFLALSLTGAAGVAVLGARRPYVGAWNFVVLGLLAVLLLPLAESMVLDKDLNDPIRMVFMGATIAVGVLNYLPTRAGPAALLLGAGCLAEIPILFVPGWDRTEAAWFVPLAVPGSVWIGLFCWLQPRRGLSAFDERWLDFRDRFGLFWAQRVREHFNNAARLPPKARWVHAAAAAHGGVHGAAAL